MKNKIKEITKLSPETNRKQNKGKNKTYRIKKKKRIYEK